MKLKPVLVVLILFVTLSPLSERLVAAEEVAVVLFVAGEATGIQSGKALPLKKGAILQKKDEIRTKEGKVDVQIGTSVVIRVAAFTEIKLSELFSDSRENKSKVELISGKVFARVEKSSKKENFSVSSSSYTAGVRGTQFIIGEEAEEVRKKNPEHDDSDIPDGIFVKEGEVGVTTQSGNDVSVKANEELVTSSEGLLKKPLESFIYEKMKILDHFKKISEENYKMLRDQKLQNQELLNETKQDL